MKKGENTIMFKNKFRILRVATGIIAVCAMIIGVSGVVFASSPPGSSQDTTGSVAITGAKSLNITAPATLTFAGVTLDGSARTTTNAAGSFPLEVTDATGLAGGWDVSLSATTFVDSATSQKLNDAGTLSVTNLSTIYSPSNDGSGTIPDSSVTPASATPVAVTTAAAPTPIYNAAPLTGMGSFELDTQLSLYIPANTVSGTYSSTITVSIASEIQ